MSGKGIITIEGEEYTFDEFLTALMRTMVETPDGPGMLGHWIIKNMEDRRAREKKKGQKSFKQVPSLDNLPKNSAKQKHSD